MADLTTEIAAYDRMRASLEGEALGKWIVIHDEQLRGTFNSFEEAAAIATKQFGRGPYLIRQVGAAPIILPASAMYNVLHANGILRV